MFRNQDILDCLEEGTEGCLSLVGSIGKVPVPKEGEGWVPVPIEGSVGEGWVLVPREGSVGEGLVPVAEKDLWERDGRMGSSCGEGSVGEGWVSLTGE